MEKEFACYFGSNKQVEMFYEQVVSEEK